MKVLAIETSCDETGIALVEGKKTEHGFSFTVLGNALHSQAELHAEYGGVYPNLAKREHQKNLPTLLAQCLRNAGTMIYHSTTTDLSAHVNSIDAIAVTSGPGLEPALWTGITFAQKLAAEWQKPIFGVNHLEGHLISSLARKEHSNILTAPRSELSSATGENIGMFRLEIIQFPVLGLLVSGGHTQFVSMKDWFEYDIVGETLDDAVGECFDKVARMLGLPYPGGPHISRLAEHARMSDIKCRSFALPRPMLHADTCNTSFSGLKTAALYALRDRGGIQKLSVDEVAAFAREFEDAVTDVFLAKTRKALADSGAVTFVIGGGVAANKHLRESLVEMIEKEFPYIEIRLPDLSITGDNAIMIAEAALTHLLTNNWDIKNPPLEIRADGNVSLAIL